MGVGHGLSQRGLENRPAHLGRERYRMLPDPYRRAFRHEEAVGIASPSGVRASGLDCLPDALGSGRHFDVRDAVVSECVHDCVDDGGSRTHRA